MKGLGVTVSILLGFQAMVFAIPKSPIFKDLRPVTNGMWRTGENEFLVPTKLTLVQHKVLSPRLPPSIAKLKTCRGLQSF